MSENLFNVFLGFLGTLIGGLITYSVSKCFYMKAAKDLGDVTCDLKRQSSILARLLEREGKAIYDGEGKLVGLILELKPDPINAKSNAIADLTVEKGE